MDPNFLILRVDTNPKGQRTFTLDLDEYEMFETGNKDKEKDGKKYPTSYITFKIVEKK
jgi:hypothetical protein